MAPEDRELDDDRILTGRPLTGYVIGARTA